MSIRQLEQRFDIPYEDLPAWMLYDYVHGIIAQADDGELNCFNRLEEDRLLDCLARYCCAIELERWAQLADIALEEPLEHDVLQAKSNIPNLAEYARIASETLVSADESWSLMNNVVSDRDIMGDTLLFGARDAVRRVEEHMNRPGNGYIVFIWERGNDKPIFLEQTFLSMVRFFLMYLFELTYHRASPVGSWIGFH